jgi:hypothetical protein
LTAVAPSKSRGIFCPLILAKKFDAIGDISSGHDGAVDKLHAFNKTSNLV